MYGKILSKVLIASNFNLWIEMSFRILRSIGVQRGKNDKIDAERIARYAEKNQEKAQLYKAPKKVLGKNKSIISIKRKDGSFQSFSFEKCKRNENF